MANITNEEFQRQMKRLDGLARPVYDEEVVEVLYRFFKDRPLETLETAISLYKMDGRIYPVPGDLIRIVRELEVRRRHKKYGDLDTDIPGTDTIQNVPMPELSQEEWEQVEHLVETRVHPFHKTRKVYQEVSAKPIQDWGKGEVTGTEVYMRVLRDRVILDMQQQGMLTRTQERR